MPCSMCWNSHRGMAGVAWQRSSASSRRPRSSRWRSCGRKAGSVRPEKRDVEMAHETPLRAFGDAFGYDTSYGAELIDLDLAAGLALARLSKVAAYRADAPPAAWHAAKIVAAMSEDCGPCVQLGVTIAQRGGVPDSDLRAIVVGDVARMSVEASLGYRFARALLARSVELDDLRAEIVRCWGRKALAAISIGIVTVRTFPAQIGRAACRE